MKRKLSAIDGYYKLLNLQGDGGKKKINNRTEQNKASLKI